MCVVSVVVWKWKFAHVGKLADAGAIPGTRVLASMSDPHWEHSPIFFVILANGISPD